MADNEKNYVVQLRNAFEKPTRQRAKYAIREIRAFLSGHLKLDSSLVKLSSGINSAVLKRGIKKIPRRLSLTVKLDGGKAMAYLASEYLALSSKEKVKVAKPEAPKPKAVEKTEDKKEQQKEQVKHKKEKEQTQEQQKPKVQNAKPDSESKAGQAKEPVK